MKHRMLLQLLTCAALLPLAVTAAAQFDYYYSDPFDPSWPGTDWELTLNSGTWDVVDAGGGDYYVTGTGPYCSAHSAYSHVFDEESVEFGDGNDERAEWGYDIRIPSASDDISFAIILGTPGGNTLGFYVIIKTCNPSSYAKVTTWDGISPVEHILDAPQLARDYWYTLTVSYDRLGGTPSFRVRITDRDGDDGLPDYDVNLPFDLNGFGPLDAITIAAESTSVHHFDNVFLRSTTPPVPNEAATWGAIKGIYSR